MLAIFSGFPVLFSRAMSSFFLSITRVPFDGVISSFFPSAGSAGVSILGAASFWSPLDVVVLPVVVEADAVGAVGIKPAEDFATAADSLEGDDLLLVAADGEMCFCAVATAAVALFESAPTSVAVASLLEALKAAAGGGTGCFFALVGGGDLVVPAVVAGTDRLLAA